MVYPDKKATSSPADKPAQQESEVTVDPQRLLAAGTVEGSTAERANAASTVVFLADRELTPEQLRQALDQAGDEEKQHLLTQILCHAPWAEIWTYITPQQLQQELPNLPISDDLQVAWQAWLQRSLGTSAST